MKIAVRVPNWIGDGVMAIPAIRALRALHPDATLHIVSMAYLADVFLHLPEIDEIITLPRERAMAALFAGARLLRRRRFDQGVLLTNSFSSALLFKLAGVRDIAGYNRDGRGLLLHRKIAVPAVYGHHMAYYSQLIARLAGDRALPEFPAEVALAPEELASADALLASLGIAADVPLLAISPAAAYGSAKCWEPEGFTGLIARLRQERPDSRILLLGSRREKEAIVAMMPRADAAVYNLAGRLSLRQAIIVLSRCRLVVANDSGIMHLASALHLPIVAIFGATLPQKSGPGSPRQRVIFHPADCTPCRYRRCPVDHACMRAVSLEEVLSACRQLLDQEGERGESL